MQLTTQIFLTDTDAPIKMVP